MQNLPNLAAVFLFCDLALFYRGKAKNSMPKCVMPGFFYVMRIPNI